MNFNVDKPLSQFVTLVVAASLFGLASCAPPPNGEYAPAAGSDDTEQAAKPVDFAAPIDGGAPVDVVIGEASAGLQVNMRPIVETIGISPVVDGAVSVTLSGMMPNGCASVSGAEWVREGSEFKIGLVSQSVEGECPDVLTPFEYALDLPLTGLDVGTYQVSADPIVSSFELAESQAPAAGSNGGQTTVITCAEPIGSERRLLSLEGGFCLNHPETYEAIMPTDGINLLRDASFEPPPNSDAVGVSLSIETFAAEGRTSEEIADERLNGLGEADGVERSTLQMGGETWIVADGLPGLATVRQAFLVRDGSGIGHVMTVMPMDPDLPELSAESAKLWDGVAASLRFFNPPGAH